MYKIAFVGGHITTAQAVIEKLLTSHKFTKDDFVFLGKKHEFGSISVEEEIVRGLGIDFFEIKAVKFNRFFTPKNFVNLIFFPLTIFQNIFLLLKLRPKIIFSFGGYLSLPVCLAGKILNAKIFIHEGTVAAGAANRFISHFASLVMISFSSSSKFFKNSILTGCPLRKSILNAVKVQSNLPMILISGGHSGSKTINSCLEKIVSDLLDDFIVIHQTGKLDFEKISSLRAKISQTKRIRYVVKSFFSDLEFASYLVNANVYVGRSGINTVSEIIFLKKYAIFIPLPFAQKNEQFENAILAKSLGLAEIIEQKNLNSNFLLDEIRASSNRNVDCIDIREYEALFKNAAEKICNLIYEEKI